MIAAEKTQILRVGDTVTWRADGTDTPRPAKIKRIEKTPNVFDHHGTRVEEVAWTDDFIADLDNGHWAFKRQLEPRP